MWMQMMMMVMFMFAIKRFCYELLSINLNDVANTSFVKLLKFKLYQISNECVNGIPLP